MPGTRVTLDALLAARQPDASVSGTVLYIEDNELNAMIVEESLRPLTKVQVEHALDGRTGLEVALRLKPELILVDMVLPDIQGLDVLEALRAMTTLPRETPIVVLSGLADPRDVKEASLRGATDYWTKPLELKSFLINVKRLLSLQL